MKWIFFVFVIFILGCSTGEQAADSTAGIDAGDGLTESGLEEVEDLEIEDEEFENLDEDLTLLEDL